MKLQDVTCSWKRLIFSKAVVLRLLHWGKTMLTSCYFNYTCWQACEHLAVKHIMCHDELLTHIFGLCLPCVSLSMVCHSPQLWENMMLLMMRLVVSACPLIELWRYISDWTMVIEVQIFDCLFHSSADAMLWTLCYAVSCSTCSQCNDTSVKYSHATLLVLPCSHGSNEHKS